MCVSGDLNGTAITGSFGGDLTKSLVGASTNQVERDTRSDRQSGRRCDRPYEVQHA